MPESPDLYAEVRLMRAEIDDHGAMLQMLLRTQGRELSEAILAEMHGDRALARAFLHVDGVRTQGEILAGLAKEGIRGASKAGMSRKFDKLANDLHLIALVRRTSTGNVYRKTVLDRALGISRALEREANKAKDGGETRRNAPERTIATD